MTGTGPDNRDTFDSTKIVSVLREQLAKTPTTEEIGRAHEDPALSDAIGDWLTIILQFAQEAIERIEGKGSVVELKDRFVDLQQQYRHDFGIHGPYKPVTIESAAILCRAIIAALEAPTDATEQAA